MTTVRKVQADRFTQPDDLFRDTFLVTLSKADSITMCKAALAWNVDREKCLTTILEGGLRFLAEVLPHINRPQPSKVD